MTPQQLLDSMGRRMKMSLVDMALNLPMILLKKITVVMNFTDKVYCAERFFSITIYMTTNMIDMTIVNKY